MKRKCFKESQLIINELRAKKSKRSHNKSEPTNFEEISILLNENPLEETSTNSPQCKDLLQNIFNGISNINFKLDTLIKTTSELKERVEALEEENVAMHTRLLSELLFHRKNVSTPVKGESGLPQKPFCNIDSLEEFDQSLENSKELYLKVEEELFHLPITCPGKFVRAAWKLFFTDELADKYSWRGTTPKKSIFPFALTSIIKATFNRKFDMEEKQFNRCTLRWFQTARDRIKYKEKSEQKSNDTLGNE